MAGMSRAYLVCKQCGPSSWIFQDRVGSNPFCQKCGCQWPKVHRQQPNAVSGAEWASRGGQPRVWKDKGPKVSRDRANAAPVGAAQKALSQVWASLPVTAQQAIEKAGWQPRPLSPPPGLGGKGNREQEGRRQPKGGAGKGRGATGVQEAGAESRAEVTKALFASVSDEQRELLIQLGLKAPAEPPPDLTALCKHHINSLPAAIRQLVEDPPEKPLTPQEVMSDKAKKFKIATAELRDLIFKKSSLQLRIDRHKEQFAKMLEDMKAVNESLDERQKLVSTLQVELQSSVAAAPSPGALPEAAEALAKQVEAMDVDQLEEYRQRMFEAIDEAVKRRRIAAPGPKPEVPNSGQQEQAPNQGSEAGDGKGRSRSRGRGTQQG